MILVSWELMLFLFIYYTLPKAQSIAQSCLTQRRSQKYMKHVTQPLRSADISFLSPEIGRFCYIRK